MLHRVIGATLALVCMSAAPKADTCSAPIATPPSATAPGSTYYSDAEPPARFAHVPTGNLNVRFGQGAIDELCGRPPCGLVFLGCTSGDVMALPDPYKTDAVTFARIVRHELGHHAGWPASHGA